MRLWIWALVIACIVLVLGLKLSIPDFLAGYFSKHLGVTVSIESFSFRPNELKLKKLEIANPPGYSLPKAFSASSIKMKSPLSRYIKEKIVIDEILIEDIYLGLEFDQASDTKGNWTQILQEKTSPETEKNFTRSILIKRLVLKQIQTQLLFKTNAGKVRDLPLISEIVLLDITTEGEFPTDQLARSVLGQMLIKVFIQQNLKNMLEDILKNPQKKFDKTIKPLKDFFSDMNSFPLPSEQAPTESLLLENQDLIPVSF